MTNAERQTQAKRRRQGQIKIKPIEGFSQAPEVIGKDPDWPQTRPLLQARRESNIATDLTPAAARRFGELT